MKYTLAIAALLGYVAAVQDDTTKVWELRSVNDHREDSSTQIGFGNGATAAANARPPMRSHAQIESSDSDSSSSSDSDVQVGDDKEEVDHSGEFFKASEHDSLHDDGYKRVTPVNFSADDDDIFMRSMIKTYAVEGKNKDGSPNGNFLVDEAGARAASMEVLQTHKHMTGAALQTYMTTYFPRTWNHFDVNRGGKIEVTKMPQLMRFLASDQTMPLW